MILLSSWRHHFLETITFKVVLFPTVLITELYELLNKEHGGGVLSIWWWILVKPNVKRGDWL